ncbi:hypothetical protein [Halococcus sp. PRR34]|nr:hypothetical protein [Halococcus sp. PRR34]
MAYGHDPREVAEYPARTLLLFDMHLPTLQAKRSAFYDPTSGD